MGTDNALKQERNSLLFRSSCHFVATDYVMFTLFGGNWSAYCLLRGTRCAVPPQDKGVINLYKAVVFLGLFCAPLSPAALTAVTTML
jgi:hypothetical protein